MARAFPSKFQKLGLKPETKRANLGGMDTGAPTTTETLAFEEEAQDVISRVRNAFAAVLEALPGHVARAHEVSKALGVHKKLGWQIANVIYEPDVFAAAHHIPGRSSVKTFLEAAASRRVGPKLIQSAEAALGDFERLIEVHAGDRESLDMMLTACARECAEPAQLELRKMAFRGNSAIWGVQAKTRLNASLVHPGTRAGWCDVALLNGHVKLRRTRSNVAWEIVRTKFVADDGADGSRQPKREALDRIGEKAGNATGVPLLRQFCSQALPQVERKPLSNGWVQDVLVGGPVGETGAVDCFTAEVWRGLGPCYRTEHDWLWVAAAKIRTACEVLVFDQFVHEDVFGPIRPELQVYSDLAGGSLLPGARQEADRLPAFESVQHLGKGISAIRTPDVPRYVEIVHYAFDRLGWDPARFDVFRVRMEFPAMPATVAMESPLPEPPTA